MYILGIQGSPRKNGNSDYLLTAFLKECEAFGARTEVIRPQDHDIQPCKELIVCEKKGFCPIKDQMETLGYEKVKQADVVVLSSPVFFYGISAQAKIFVDRCQMLWGRKYKLGLKDPDRFSRQGFLLSVGASAGKRLFEGVDLTARYFFDAISADYSGSLTYKKVEDAGDIIVRPELEQEIRDAVSHLLQPMVQAPKLLFVSSWGACRSLMAAALAKEISKGRIRAAAAGLAGPARADKETLRAMAESHLDVKYAQAFGLAELPQEWQQAETVVFLGTRDEFEKAAGLTKNARFWDIPAPVADDAQSIMEIRNRISGQVKTLLPD